MTCEAGLPTVWNSCRAIGRVSTACASTIRGASKKLPPVHPGEVLLEEFLKPRALSQNRLGLNIGAHPRRITEMVLHKRRVTAETALRLARHFDTSPQFWLGLHSDYDLDVAADELGERLEREVQVHAKAS